MISAQEAYRIGLVNEVVPAANLIARAEAILKQIASNAPVAVRLVARAPSTRDWTPARARASRSKPPISASAPRTEDKKEGTSAFLEKRAPQFRGR